jgi:trk system potassium uptake protein TrkH
LARVVSAVVSLARPGRAGLDLSAPQLLVSSFAGLIAAGTAGFLWLPGLWTGPGVGFVDALFMATSAVCVTGLSVLDVSSRMTFWGQLWLLALIQLGGLGILTLAALAAAALGRRASLEMEEAAGGPTGILLPVSSPLALVRAVVAATLAVEALGATALWLAWVERLGASGAVWPAVFHAVSAFCNAGFSIFAGGLVGFATHVPTVLIVAVLIVLGGIGFLVFEDVRHRLAGRRRRLTVHSRLALSATGLLLALGLVLYLFFESGQTLAGFGIADRLTNALFLSVTPRTAGFNTVDYDALSNPSVLLTIGLMWIGGSPGSTAGGVKTTSVALIALLFVARLRGRGDVSVADRTIPDATVQRAVGLAVGGALILLLASFVLSWTELAQPSAHRDRAHFVRLVFEAQSALGTVGLSMGVTDELSQAGRLIMVALMFVGRVGPLAVLEAMARRSAGRARFRLGREDVLVG